MPTPIDSEKLPPSGVRTQLPALPVAPTDPRQVQQFLTKMKEIIEVREGSRGSGYERVVTWRDLWEMGLVTNAAGSGGLSGRTNTRGNVLPSELSGLKFADIMSTLEKSLRESNLFRDLTTRIDDAQTYASYPEEIRALLVNSLADEARLRGTAITSVERKIDETERALTYRMETMTAAVASAVSGVQHLSAAYADEQEAFAIDLTQVTARMDNAGGTGVTVEEKLTAHADSLGNLEGQWAIKLDVNGKIAGIGLANTASEAGVGTSELIVLADKFGFFTDAGDVMPFGIDEAGVYINGSLRVNSGGVVLDAITSPSYVIISTTIQAFTRPNSGAAFSPPASTLTATPYSGTVSAYQWQYYNGSAWVNVPSGGTSNTYTVTATDFTDARTYRIQATISGTVFADEITLVQLTGGTSVISGYLTNESASLPASSSGTVTDFSAGAGSFRMFDGTTDKTGTAGPVTYTVASQTGCTVGINSAGTYSVSAMATDSASATLQAVFSGVTIQKVLTLSKSKAGATGLTGLPGANGTNGTNGINGTNGAPGAAGQRGSVEVAAVSTATAWSDTAANSAITALGYATKVAGDIVTLYKTTAPKWSTTKYWNGSSWLALTAYINGNLLVSGTLSVGTLDIAGNAVTQLVAAPAANTQVQVTSSSWVTLTSQSVAVTASQPLAVWANCLLAGAKIGTSASYDSYFDGNYWKYNANYSGADFRLNFVGGTNPAVSLGLGIVSIPGIGIQIALQAAIPTATVPAGTYTVQLQAKATAGLEPVGVRYSNMALLDAKR